jgi:uncharacterized protein YkwD
LCYETYQGWKAGFIALGITFISFAISLWLAVLFQNPVAQFFTDKFGIATMITTLMAYIGLTMVSQMILVHLLSLVVAKFPPKIEKSKINNVLGSVVSGINALTIIAFVLVLILAIPLKGTVRADIRASLVGGSIVHLVEKYGGPINFTVNQFEKSAAKFLTIDPGSKETMQMDVAPKPEELEVDDTAERKLLELVNKERAAAGVPALVVDVRIVKVARDHSRDMFTRRYFSHYTPDGKDLGDRLSGGDIKYALAGENLAYAPDVPTAHQGLMDSPEHKKNLLDPQFRHVGIGIISTSRYGMMVTEDFIN